MKRPTNLYMNDERFAMTTGEWDPIIELGWPGARGALDLKETRALLKWLTSAVAYMEWKEAENKRIEREDNL